MDDSLPELMTFYKGLDEITGQEAYEQASRELEKHRAFVEDMAKLKNIVEVAYNVSALKDLTSKIKICIPDSTDKDAVQKAENDLQQQRKLQVIQRKAAVETESLADNVRHIFTIDMLDENLKRDLNVYINRGNQLRQMKQTCKLTENIANVIKMDSSNPKIFYFIEASSGMGKSQLAASLELPVVYIPLNVSQTIYKCFTNVHAAILSAIDLDNIELEKMTSYGVLNKVRSQNLMYNTNSFNTVGLLMALLEIVCDKSNEESFKLLCGYSATNNIEYSTMTLAAARKTVQEKLKGNVSIPLFVIDEVPAIDNKQNMYEMCIILRNFIRCMNCVCLLCGTEAAAMNAIDNVEEGSRGTDNTEYLRLVVDLPPTQLNIFSKDEKYENLIPRLSPYLCEMLQRTRPLFVQYVLDALLSEETTSNVETETIPLTVTVLSAVKKKLLNEKSRFVSDSGLYAQLAMLHSKFIQHTTTTALSAEAQSVDVDAENIMLNTSDTDVRHAQVGGKHTLGVESSVPAAKYRKLEVDAQVCVRHHFAAMRVNENVFVDNGTVSLFLPAEENLSLTVKLANSNNNIKFWPNVVFAQPNEDPLLHLICNRNGIYYRDHNTQMIQRVSTSFGLQNIYLKRMQRNAPQFLNSNQFSPSGKFLESELTSAAVVSSHSLTSLSGCPVSQWLGYVIKELNHKGSFGNDPFEMIDVPTQINNMHIGLLSAVSARWRDSGDTSMLLADMEWNNNNARNDGSFPIMVGGQKRSASLEAKCYKNAVPTIEVVKTMNNTTSNENALTVMVATKVAEIGKKNKRFLEAAQSCNVYKITRIASRQDETTTKLKWTPLHRSQDKHCRDAYATVVVIDLESIYPGRYDLMSRIYNVT